MSTLSARRPLLVVAVLAMVATMLFAINAGTASAAAPAHTAEFTACPDNAGIPPAGFSDTAGSIYDSAVDCLKYYIVTEGTTPSTYSPQADVTRSQMAQFLARLAYSAGVVLNPTPPNAGFTDIGGESPAAQLAINQLADAGITVGRTPTTYEPGSAVLRSQMAMFLTRFLSQAHVPPGSHTVGSAATSGAPFTDISTLPNAAWVAIQQAWDLGITSGATATTYNPLGHVTRGQMALFLTRVASQANTRPAGVNMQGVQTEGFGPFTLDIAVTVRNADFSPSPNTDVDQFSTSSSAPFWSAPWWADGTCKPAAVSSFAGALGPCTLNVADPTVDTFGNLPVASATPFSGTTTAAYAWTGPIGQTFNINSTAYSMISILSHEPATQSVVTTDIPKEALTFAQGYYADGPFARYGTVNYTVQLLDQYDHPVPQAGVTYTVKICDYDGNMINAIFPYPLCRVQLVTTDATGAATFPVTRVDPSLSSGDEQVSWVHVYNAPASAPLLPLVDPDNHHTAINWRDISTEQSVMATSAVDTMVVGPPGPPMENMITGTVYDMFGYTVFGERVFFEGDNTDGLGYGMGPTAPGPYAFGRTGTPEIPPAGAVDHEGQTNLTNGSGQAFSVYNWSSPLNGVENIMVWTTSTRSGEEGTLTVTWTLPAAAGPAGPAVMVDFDVAAGTFVIDVGAGDYREFTWTSDDVFWVNGAVVTQAVFETAVAASDANDTMEASTYVPNTAGNVFEFVAVP